MITMEQFLLRQPSAPKETSTDIFYFNLTNKLIEISKDKNLFPSYPEKVIERGALALIGYYQDVISDAGVWHTFIDENRRLYNKTLPFYEISSDYIDYELNKEDVCFMVWYALSMNYENKRVANPFDKEIIQGAEEWWKELENAYDSAPIPENYRLTHELEIHSEEDSAVILKLGNWLFMHCYLMTPAYAMTLSEIASEFDLSKEDDIIAFQHRLEQSMAEDPTGPLALYLSEWLYLIIEGKRPPKTKTEELPEHKYYTSFVEATGGEIIKIFSSYEEMNRFFIQALGWGEGEEHLPNLKGHNDYTLMVNKTRGMLVAIDVARCINMPDNRLYDRDYAKKHSIELITERGRCPADLVAYLCKKGWLSDAVFPGNDNHEIVKENWDFMARCYLQQYYRD